MGEAVQREITTTMPEAADGEKMEGTFAVRLGETIKNRDISYHSFRCILPTKRSAGFDSLDNFAPDSVDKSRGNLTVSPTREATLTFPSVNAKVCTLRHWFAALAD